MACAAKLFTLLQVEKGAEASQCETLLKSALNIFSRNVQSPFHITLFNLGASGFVERQSSGSASMALTKFLVAPQAQSLPLAQQAQTSSGRQIFQLAIHFCTCLICWTLKIYWWGEAPSDRLTINLRRRWNSRLQHKTSQLETSCIAWPQSILTHINRRCTSCWSSDYEAKGLWSKP